jgi:hypothetical protein
MRRIRQPDGGEARWKHNDPATICVKHGYGALDLKIGNYEISVPDEAQWQKYTYGEFRRQFGEKWAAAWLFRTNDPHDPERMDILRSRVGVAHTLMPDPNELRDGSWQDVTF